MRATRLFLGTVTISATTLVCMASPASASSDYAFNQSSCADDMINVVSTQILATDHGSTVDIDPGTFATSNSKSCDGEDDLSADKTVTLTLTATGWGIDCSASLPGGFSCTGSSTERTITASASGDDAYLTREISDSESVYFEDGAAGDTSKVCATVSGVIDGRGTTATACTNV